MAILRAVGDLHGCIDNRNRLPDKPSFLEICDNITENDYVVQLGDFGFDYRCLDNVDSNRVKILLGNHENYDLAFNYQHMLGHFGLVNLGPFNFFFVRGGFSIDRNVRISHELQTGQKSWWQIEELSYKQGMECLKEYEQVKPDVVLSHDICDDVSKMIGSPDILKMFGWPSDMVTTTQSLLQNMLEIHQPKLHFFAHYHKNWEIKYKGCHFRCVGECSFVDVDENWNILI